MECPRPYPTDVSAAKAAIFPELGLDESNPGVFAGKWTGGGPWIEKRSPIDGTLLGRIASANSEDYEKAVNAAQSAAKVWSAVPAQNEERLCAVLQNGCAS